MVDQAPVRHSCRPPWLASGALALILSATMPGCSGSGSDAGAEGDGDVAEKVAERGPVKLTVRAEPDVLTVGDPLTVTVAVETTAGVEIEMPEVGDSLGPFAVRSAHTPPDVPDGERRRWTHTYVLDTFASGVTEIPPFEVHFTDRRPEAVDAEEGPIEGWLGTQPLGVTVHSVLGADETEEDFRDIQGTVEAPRVPGSVWPWLAVGLGAVVLLGLLLLWLWWRRGARGREPAAAPVPAHIWARAQLERLAAEKLIEHQHYHDFYFRLSDIVRAYIERRFGIMAPEQTTEEFLRVARRSGSLEEGHKILLANFLRAADMVKFAMHQPTIDESRAAFEAAVGFVEETAEKVNRVPAPEHEGTRVSPEAEVVA